MKMMRILLPIIMISMVSAQRKDLTLVDAVISLPFEIATIGQWKWVPGSDEYLFFTLDLSMKPRSLYKYNLTTGDTTLFLARDQLSYKGENLQIFDFTFHPESNKMLLVTDQQRIWRHSRFAIYFLYDLKAGSVDQIANGDRLRNVKFSPDGKSIAYVNTDNNLYVFHIDDNKEIKLTKDGSFNIINGHYGWVYEEEFSSFDAYRWSPDSKYIAFVREDQTFVKQFPLMNELLTYPEIQWIHYPKVGERNPTINIGIVNVDTRRTKWLDMSAAEEMYTPRFTWLEGSQSSSAKQELVVTRINRRQNRLELSRYNVKNGKGNVFWIDESDAWVELTDDLFFLKNGSFITLSERSGYQHIYYFDKNGILINAVSNGDWEVSEIVAIDEKKSMVYLSGRKDSVIESNLYSVKLDGSDFKLLSKNFGLHTTRFSPSKSFYIDFYSTANSTLEITLHQSDGSKIRDLTITDKEQVEAYGFPETKFIQIPTSDDGTLLNAKITLPRDFDPDKKYPVIVFGYSGPGSQTVLNRQGRRFWDRYMNQKGFITFSIDPRGTGGRGTDFKYLSYKDIVKWVVNDQVEGAKYLKSLPYVDSERIGIWGWSGG
ncbi:MAG: DPP IV N-terminal domain-containing protein, partial [Candidatus Neomarinimicrobiota bacterium]